MSSARRRFELADGTPLETLGEGTCPHCHREVWFVEKPRFGVIHEQPFCAAFDLLDNPESFADYAKAVRKYEEDRLALQRAAKSERMPRA